MMSLEKIKLQNEKSYELVKLKVESGASLVAIEDKTLFQEYLDWSLCLSVVRSNTVAEKIRNFYQEAEKNREEYIAKKIEETLKEGESGILIMRDEYRMRIQSKLEALNGGRHASAVTKAILSHLDWFSALREASTSFSLSKSRPATGTLRFSHM